MIRLKKTMRTISSRITKVRALSVVSLGISALLVSCDESSIIGLNVQPTNDLLNVVYNDTTTLFTRTIQSGKLRTDAAQLKVISPTTLFGYYWDPVFGKTSASIYTQLTLNSINPDFGANPVIDSVVLSLVYDTSYCYGKTPKAPQNINVYQLAESMVSNTIYYSDQTLSLSATSTVLTNAFSVTPNLTSSRTIDGEVLRPGLRVPLDTAFGRTLLNSKTTGALSSNAAFQTFMKGLYITTENMVSMSSGEGNILKINFADSQTRVRLYYHSGLSKFNYDFSIGTTAALFTHFNHSFTDLDMVAQISGSTGKQNDIVYVQAMNGTEVKIEMPYITSLNNSGIHTINKSELVIKVDTSALYQTHTFTPPAQLYVYGINDDGTNYVLSDAYEPANYSYGNYIGGIYNASAAEYRINISRYVQQIVSGKVKNNGLYLVAYKGAYSANRVVLGGGSSSAYQMKLHVTYTK
jgi:Domain of unknown function (DUF4270)